MRKKIILCMIILIAIGYGFLIGYKRVFPFYKIMSIKQNFNTIGWDKRWDKGNKFESKYFEKISIKSSLDGKIQNAYMYKAKNKNRPLIISLHAWSNDYKEYDPLAVFAKEYDINYIHPDFRGANWTPDACCSEKVTSDIDDSIQYMIDNAQINQDNMSVVGSSGGGYAALCAYFKTKFKIKQFFSWVPITELQDWYIESKLRGNPSFANDIYKCTNSSENILNFEEVKKRSPMYFDLNSNTFFNSNLNIYAGIHDRIVSISHSINIFNEILKKDNANRELMVQKENIKYMLANKSSISLNYGEIEGRKIFNYWEYKKVTLTIFDGRHEMLFEHTKKKILG